MMTGGPHLESPEVVTGIGTTSPLHCFRDDVCPGDELKEIQKKLGTFENKIEAADATHQLLYRLTSDGCMLSIGTQDSRTVRDIDIYCLR